MPAVFVAVRDIPLGDLARFPGNARRGDVTAIRSSLRRHGQYRSLVVRDTGAGLVVLAGNHTRDALDAEGCAMARCEVIECSDDEARRINLADNRLAELGGYDDADLAALLTSLDGDFDGTGWAQEDLDVLLAGEPESRTDPDDVPEPPAEPVTQPGDLWQLGPHRLLCGDSTVVTDQDRLLAGAAPVLMATDPPYGVNYDAEWRGEVQSAFAPNRTGKVSNDDRASWQDVWAISPAAVAYVWHGGLHAAEVHDDLVAAGWEVRSQIIWNKATLVMSRGAYHWKHEPCWYAVRKGATAHWVSTDRTQSTVWDAASPIQVMGPKGGEDKTSHPTQKPVVLWERPILNHLRTGEALYDPFAGSGTAIIAAHRTRRVTYAMELDPVYCDVICQRYADHTGIKPELLEAAGAVAG